jgi:hypothetical protein
MREFPDTVYKYTYTYTSILKHTYGSVVVETLSYKAEYSGFETWWHEWILSVYLILPVALDPEIYLASNRNEYQKHKNNISGEWWAAGA